MPAKGKQQKDEQLLEQHISANRLEYPKTFLVLVALIASFQPVFYSHAINDMSWTVPTNALLFVAVSLGTTYMLRQAYEVMVESEFWSRQPHFTEVSDRDEIELRRLRLQVAMGYTLFLLNSVFFILCSVFMAYIFRRADPRASYILSPLMTASILWFVAMKNEESRQRRMRLHK
ncbi:hypothetical protein STCU_03072 [Strigomonas culicis]|uniref:Uncharacterized protein n=1 Tax=Strigomonas culicis TaxID=28005 RepID=S9VY09_9TRYP|nr:hypothetical protein STCU_03072 [Strigomonas culicis]|eukprot:EPY31951.1 hypothetical protein STCU_03072 [Strigomonas culicis]